MYGVGCVKHCSYLKYFFLLFACSTTNVHAEFDLLDSLTITGSLFSEPMHLGLSEAHGRPGVALSLDLELNDHLFIGVNGYRATDSDPPNRSKNFNYYAGVHWGIDQGTQFELTLIHRTFPDDDAAITWDYTELRFDTHFSQNLALSLTGALDYYGLDEANSLGIVGNYVHNFSDKIFSRVELGSVSLDGRNLDSYQYITLGGGYRFDRVSIEAFYKTNNAEPNSAFKRPQLRDGFVVTLNWLIY